MTVHPAEFLIALLAIQALGALVLAGLMRYFVHAFGHRFLHHWALSVAALATYLASSAAALALYWSGSEYDSLRLLFSALSLGAAYPHVVWLMIGTWEATRQGELSPRREWWLVGIAALIGVASALIAPFDPEAAGLRNLVRVELRYLATGIAFVTAGILLWRAQRSSGLVGARVGAIGFLLFGLQMLHVVGINLWNRAGHPPPFYAPYAGLLDFLFQSIIGLGIVVWLLELQRRSAHRAQDELRHARRHDSTTGLPNRELLLEQIEAMLQRSPQARVAVVCLGIARYSVLSQALGWQGTERLVRIVADRLHDSVSHRCAVGRVNERDFVIARPTMDDAEQLRNWCESLLARILQPIHLDDQEIFITASAGISVCPDDTQDAEQLLQRSQQALVLSSQLGRDISFYQHIDPQQRDEVDSTLRFESDLRRGLELGQFEMHYQPIVRLDSNRVVGFEALLRWRHPELGLLRPDVFLDQAATIGMLDALESFALEASLEQIGAWNRAGRAGLFVAVNVSARRFQTTDLVERTVAACGAAGVDPVCLELEITENSALQDLDNAARKIDALHRAGIRISLDDFGTGFSSLANLLKLPVDRIKLDRIFIEDTRSNARQRELIAAMISMGRRLGIEVVAEGVEHADQLEFLRAQGCDYVQGFLLQRPAEADACSF
jgi:diguanylate cyclase (GGDEF)-like protein